MPELPDITLYVEAFERCLGGARLDRVRLGSPSLLRTVEPPLSEVEGKRLARARRLGKRVVLEFDDELFLVFHLMIAGRFHWKKLGAKPSRKVGHAAFDWSDVPEPFGPQATLMLTEASTKKRAKLHVVRAEAGLADHDPGGLEVLESDLASFSARIRAGNHTLKRALTDPRAFSGIGNAYSDEILHRARLSPVQLTGRLDDAQIERLYEATRACLTHWTELLREQNGDAFPEKVTAFRPEMAAHGRHGKACPDCGDPIQRIVYASNETNYCATCQTGGKLLADRALSRLLKKDWPRTLEELEERMPERARAATATPAGAEKTKKSARKKASRAAAPGRGIPGRSKGDS